MHFLYIDESGDTGYDCANVEQPLFVMGGISLSDERWNKTKETYDSIIGSYFEGSVPRSFELHAHELLSPNGDGPFAGHSRERRNALALRLLKAIENHKHHIHVIAFDKTLLASESLDVVLPYDPKAPYLLGFDYLITQFNNHISSRLGTSASGLIILDKKENYHTAIELILHSRRFQVVASHRVRRIVEFSYPIDSHKNPMVQLSDLVIYCTRKFLEVDLGHAKNWKQEAKDYYATCYRVIESRMPVKAIVARSEPSMRKLNKYLETIRVKPTNKWKAKYVIKPD